MIPDRKWVGEERVWTTGITATMTEAVVATLAAAFEAVLPVAPLRCPPNSFPVNIHRSPQCETDQSETSPTL